jgi:hypothetical protein
MTNQNKDKTMFKRSVNTAMQAGIIALLGMSASAFAAKPVNTAAAPILATGRMSHRNLPKCGKARPFRMHQPVRIQARYLNCPMIIRVSR